MRLGHSSALFAALVTLFFAAPAHATFPGANGKLVFFGSVSGTSGLYTMNPDTTGTTLLYAGGTEPQWSPDGQRVVFRGCSVTICKINADGSGLTPLANGKGEPSWSPDGTKIAYVRRDVDPQSGMPLDEIYTMNSDGTNQTRLTDSSGDCPYVDEGGRGRARSNRTRAGRPTAARSPMRTPRTPSRVRIYTWSPIPGHNRGRQLE